MPAPIRHNACYRPRPDVPAHRSPPHQHRHPHRWQGLHHPAPPHVGTHPWWRQISTLGIIARKAKRHRHNRHAAAVIKHTCIQPQPIAQPVPAGIGKRAARCVYPRARCLPRNQQLRACIKPHHRARHMPCCRGRKPVSTDAAFRDALLQFHRQPGNTCAHPPRPSLQTGG